MKTKVNDKAMKPKILFIMHMPPPVHGAAMVGQYIHDSELIILENWQMFVLVIFILENISMTILV